MENNEPYNLDWSFSEAWNGALEAREEREVKPRNNIWASELGKSPIDVYLKMKGTPLSNPPNPRSLRKFEAGNFFEWLVGLVLKRAGILQSSQERVSVQYPDLCEVTGKMDYLAGGKPDKKKFEEELRAFELPESFYKGFEAIIDHLNTKYPNGLGHKPVEIKSVSSFMFEGILKTGRALKIHRLQEMLYLKAQNIEQGMVVYICRDDLRMIEIPVFNNFETEKELIGEIALLSKYFLANEQPPLEKMIVWDEDLGKFCKNFNVAYSGYLTMLYGIQDQAEFDDKYQPIALSFNRVMGRLKKAKTREAWLASNGVTEADVLKEKGEGKKTATIQYIMKGDEKIYIPDDIKTGYSMTDKNLEVLAQIRDMGFDPEELVAKFAVGPEEEETE